MGDGRDYRGHPQRLQGAQISGDGDDRRETPRHGISAMAWRHSSHQPPKGEPKGVEKVCGNVRILKRSTAKTRSGPRRISAGPDRHAKDCRTGWGGQTKRARLDRGVLEHFKATGKGWQTRMNEALKNLISKRKAS